MKIEPKMLKILRRRLGKKRGKQTNFQISFELWTPKTYFDPEEDEVMLLDLLDNLQQQIMNYHAVPGFKLTSVVINERKIV